MEATGSSLLFEYFWASENLKTIIGHKNVFPISTNKI